MITRRKFIWAGLTTAGGLALGIAAPDALRLARQYRHASVLGATPADICLIEIAADGSVTVFSPLTEMGQGIWLTLAQIAAEELDVDLQRVSVKMAPSWRAYGTPVEFYTGGSSSAQRLYKDMRKVGAAARSMLISAASAQWQVPAAECSTEAGAVSHAPSGRSSPYGELAGSAASTTPPENPQPKARSSWRVLGKPQTSPAQRQIVSGATRYGIDFVLPDMVVAAVAQSPVDGATLTSFDRARIMSQPGVLRIVELPDTLAVVAPTFWQAQRALQLANIQWRMPEVSTDNLRTQLRAAVEKNASSDAAGPGKLIISAVYEVPFVAHMQMEPLNATVRVTRIGPKPVSAELWVPTQVQDAMQVQVSRALNIWSQSVTVHTPILGGGFGRRLRVDYGVTAAHIASEFDVPVKVIWSREEDSIQGRFRPMCAARLEATVGDSGELLEWRAAAASAGEQRRTWGLEALPYKTTEEVSHTGIATPIRTGPWRSVDASQNVFFRESFIDECALAAGADPLRYRHAMLSNSPRGQRVLDALAQLAAWPSTTDGERFLGCAYNEGFGSLCALAAQAQVDDAGEWRITTVWVVVDCGIALNPNSIRAQLEGGVVFGLSAALFEAATYNGALEQRNFDRYRLLRMNEAPRIETQILESDDVEIGGIGEVAVPLIAPAAVNAIFAATGRRLRSLPLRSTV